MTNQLTSAQSASRWTIIGEGPGPLWTGGHMRVDHSTAGRMLDKGEAVEVIPVGSAYDIARESADLRSALRKANRALCEARNCLSSGMRAGTAEAIEILDAAADASSAALDQKERQ